MSQVPPDQTAPSKTDIATRVHRELHERPPLDVQPPAHIHHVAYLLPEQEGSRKKACADALELFRALDINLMRITWELHSEFVTYTFIHMAAASQSLGFGPMKLPETIPTPQPDWERIVALDILVTGWVQLKKNERQYLFGNDRLYGSQMQGGKAQVWTTFQLDESSWEQYLILAGELTPLQLGRQIKRLVEIENYYHLILMPLDCFRERSAELRELETAFTRHTQEMFSAMVDASSEDERSWLALLTEHSGKVTKLKEAMRYRMGAAHSYDIQLRRILDALGEERVPEGNQPLGTFLSARIGPAVRGYDNFNERLDSLSRGLDRASNMLRTRVEMTVQKQNLELLEGMSKQGRQQIMLQMTVEGLSVIVLSYYLSGLFGYAIKALAKLNWLVGDPAVWQGGAVPLSITIAVAITSIVHHKVRKQ